MTNRDRRVWNLLTAALLAPATAFGGAVMERGFDASSAYSMSDVDTVNVFNGNLILSLPIGQSYPVNAGFSYQLKLIYNASVWDHITRPGRHPSQNDNEPLAEVAMGQPQKDANAGVGWKLSLGELYPPKAVDDNDDASDLLVNGSRRNWLYVTPDGASHLLYESLHADVVDDQPTVVKDDVMYTRDSSYIRMRKLGERQRVIELADGAKHIFECASPGNVSLEGCWRVTSMQDRFGNAVNVVYFGQPGGLQRWELQDTVGRTQKVHFKACTGCAFGHGLVDKVELTAFGGATAVYSFDYDILPIARGCHPSLRTAFQFHDGSGFGAEIPADITTPLLKSILLPDGTSHEFTYQDHRFAEAGTRSGVEENCLLDSGRIESMTLPTGALVEWTYQDYPVGQRFVSNGIDSGDGPDVEGGDTGGQSPAGATPRGVSTRTLRDADGAVIRTTRYLLGGIGEKLTQCPQKVPEEISCTWGRQHNVIVVDPEGDATVHYFNIYSEDSVWFDRPFLDKDGTSVAHGWNDADFGLNFTRYIKKQGLSLQGEPAQDLFLSTERYDCPAGHDFGGQGPPPPGSTSFREHLPGCTLLRSEYVAYESDPFFSGQGGGCTQRSNDPITAIDCREVNRRIAGTLTEYHDDPKANGGPHVRLARHADFDGLGHYRTTKATADFGNEADSITTRTNYLAGGGPVFQPAAASPWVLMPFDWSTVEQGGQISKTFQCVDRDTGFLSKTRQLRNFGVGLSAQDVLAEFEQDANGNVATIRYFGGDTGAVSTGGAACDFAGGAVEYLQKQQFSAGVLQRRAWIDRKDSATELLLEFEQVVDPHTGQVSSTQDTAGVTTRFEYDRLGRLRSQRTDGFASTTYEWCRNGRSATNGVTCPAGPNSVRLTQSAAGKTVADTTYLYDDLGRLVEERSEVHVDATSRETLSRRYAYDAKDRRIRETVAKVGPNLQNDNQTFRHAYDALDRLTSTVKPDGKSVTRVPKGDRSITTRAEVETPGGPVNAEREERFDAAGRLFRVTEESGANGAAVSVDYEYDVGGRLTRATFPNAGQIQVRTYLYDNLGRLRSAQYPELGVGTETFRNYDSMGHLLDYVRADGTEIFHRYDKVGRVTRIVALDPRSGAKLKPIAETYYASANAGTNLKAGKPVLVKRHNYVPASAAAADVLQDVIVSESYRYEHPAGLMTDRQVRASILALTAGGAPSRRHRKETLGFDASYAYDAQGLLSQQRYPSCQLMGCSQESDEFRTVSYAYGFGRLTNVSTQLEDAPAQNVAQFEYHPNGLISAIQHQNGVVDSVELDEHHMMRPKSFAVTHAADSHWSSGAYAYDAWENVTSIGTDRYGYDRVSRLVSATVGGKSQSATYDAAGNIVTLVTNGATAPISVDPLTNRLSTGGSVTHAYDANGNVTGWNGRQIAYDALNMITSTVWSSGSSINKAYAYGPDNKRAAVLDHAGGSERWYLRGSNGKKVREVVRAGDGSPVVSRDHVFSGDNVLASISYVNGSAQGARHYHLDHLGNTRVVTNDAGAEVAEYVYYPFGEFASKTGAEADNQDLLFTGHERDRNGASAQDDLDYMMARYYAPNIGRFLSVDLATGKAAAPQTWNRYSYVSGNPLRFKDPTGGYQENFHLGMTYFLAKHAGFSESQARTIATSNQSVDTGPTNPIYGITAVLATGWFGDRRTAAEGILRGFHAFEGDREVFRALALAQPTLEGLGRELHPFQDASSHTGGANLGFGHARQVTAPDITSNDPQKATYAAMDTYDVLATVADRMNLSGYGKAPYRAIHTLMNRDAYVRSYNPDSGQVVYTTPETGKTQFWGWIDQQSGALVEDELYGYRHTSADDEDNY